MSLAYEDEWVQLHCGDCREILPTLPPADLVLTDPPYGETSLAWDVPPDGWVPLLDAPQAWVCGSARMALFGAFSPLLDGGWRFGQDVVWEKHNGSSFHADRFKRVHEHVLHFYRGRWDGLHLEPPVTLDATAWTVRRKRRPPHMGHIEQGAYASHDGGPRLMTSVLYVRSMHGSAIHETEKPAGLLRPLISYSCPPGGLVIDPFAGSASTLVAARELGRRAIGIEADPAMCERAVRARLAQMELDRMMGEGRGDGNRRAGRAAS
jgi:site-specific DNA-methyltransferase (adenine-specific)